MTGFTERLTVLLALGTPTGPAIPAILLLLFGLISIGVVLFLTQPSTSAASSVG